MHRFIATGDIHLTSRVKKNRRDSYLEVLLRKLEWLKALCEARQATLLIAGDVFDTPTVDYGLLNTLQGCFPKTIMVAGNHDLPYASMDYLQESAYLTLTRCQPDLLTGIFPQGPVIHPFGDDFALEALNWGESPTKQRFDLQLVHRTLWEEPFAPGQTPGAATSYLQQQFGRVVISGDNHIPFMVRLEPEPDDPIGERILINCGSLMKITTAQKDYLPAVWQVEFRDDGTVGVERIFCPIEDVVIEATDVLQPIGTTEQFGEFIQGLEGFSHHFDVRQHFKRYISECPSQEVRDLCMDLLVEL